MSRIVYDKYKNIVQYFGLKEKTTKNGATILVGYFKIKGSVYQFTQCDSEKDGIAAWGKVKKMGTQKRPEM